MLEINLLPEDLRPKKQSLIIFQLQQGLVYVVPAAIGLLIIIHLFLGVLYLFKAQKYKSLNNKWTQLSSQRQKVQAWENEYKVNTQQFEQMDKLITHRIIVSNQLQVLTEALPDGIWFNQLKLEQKKFSLKGSVVSLGKGQMSLLNLFLSRLKQDELFFSDFSRLELGRMSMRTLGGFSIMDFVLEGELK